MSPFYFCFFSVHLMSCENTKEDKAKDAIHIYLDENLDDMTSYEPVKFGNLVQFPDSLLNHPDFINSKPAFKMFHSYRIMGKKGHKILLKKIFVLNKDFNKTQEYNKYYWDDYYLQSDTQE